MVLLGLPFQRVVSRVALALLSLVSFAWVSAQPNEAAGTQIAGTMPEDYLPDLKEILANALKRSPEIITKEFERLVQEARVTQVKSQLLPQLGGSFSYGITQSATAGSSSEQSRASGFFYAFGLSQAVFHWGALKNQSDSARINLLVTDKNYAIAYRELSVLLRKTYLALIVELARLRQARASVQLVRNDVAVATAKKELGAVSAAAFEGEKLRLRESELDLERAEGEFGTNRRRFARLAGLPDMPEERVPIDIPRPVYSQPRVAAMTATLLRDNAKNTWEYAIYELRIRDATLQQKIQATRLLPKFGASAGYSLRNNTTVNGASVSQQAVTEQTLGISGSWNIFDGFATSGVKREALAVKRSLEYRKTVDLEQLLQNAQNLERTLRLDSEQLDISDIRRGLAIEGHRRVTEEAGFGNVAKGEIDRAKIGVMQAEANTLITRAAFLGHWSEFVAIAGDDPVLNNLPARYVRAKK